MNPLTNMRNVTKLSQRELEGRGKSSWHDEYRDSAWIFVGGLPYDLTEGDILAVFSQYGEIVNVNLIRDKATGKSKGFTFICYENQKSTILAVDNFNGMKLLGRSVRVDHVKDYKPPKDSDKYDDITRMLHAQGCAPDVMETSILRVTSNETVVKRRREEEVEEERDDGLGSHSVLKGFKNIDSRIKEEPIERNPDDGHSTIKSKDKHKVSTTILPFRSGERANDKEEAHRERSSKKKHRSKKSKRTHSKSKNDKKRKKHKKRSSSDESDSSDSSSSDSESESSSDDSRKRRRHKKKSSR